MTFQPPNDQTPWQGQPAQPTPQHPHGPPPVKRKLGTWAIVGIVAGALVLVCCGITVLAAIVGGDVEPQANPSPTVAAVATSDTPTPPPTAAPTTAAPTTPPATPTVSPSPSTTPPPPTPAGPVKLTVPNLKGMNAAVADDKLRKLGFVNIQYGSEDENDTVVIMLTNWTVTKQSAKAGSKLAPDDLIVVTCTKQS